MKIVSINQEHTQHQRCIAFNVDEDLSPDFVRRIEYGSLTFKGEGRVLTVMLPKDGDAEFTERSVATLEQEMAKAREAINIEAAKRKRLLEIIARTAGVPLD